MAFNEVLGRMGESEVAYRLRMGFSPRAVLLLLVVGGAILRGFRLNTLGDFDFDEVAAVWYARSSPSDIVAAISAAPFEHPPGYYIGLHYWTTWFGEQEPIVRWLSVLLGLLLVPATYRLARLFVSVWPAVLAAGLVTASPLLVFFSREARMYVPATLFAVLSLWIFERAMRYGRGRDWCWLGLLVVIGGYIDYSVLLAVVAMNIVLPWRFATQRRSVITFVFIELVGIALVLPWLILSRGVHESLPAFGTGGFGLAVIREVASVAWIDVFLGDIAVRGGGRAGVIVSGLMLGLAILGIGIGVVRRRGWLLLAHIGVTGAYLGLLLAFDKPYQARYLLPAVPALAVFVALAFTVLPRRGLLAVATVGLLAIVMAGPTYATRSYYREYQRGDYRSITSTIENLARPRRPGRDEGKFRDAVVLAGPWQGWYWRHYFPDFLDKVDVWFLPEEVPPAVTAEEVNAKLSRAANNHRRLWVVLAGLEQADPDGHVAAWLSSQWQARSEVYRNGVLQLYMTNVLDLVDRSGHVDLGEDFSTELIQFTGARADQGAREAGDGVRFTLFMKSVRPVDYDLRLRVWLRSSDGTIYSKDLFAQDLVMRRTSEWKSGETYQVRTALWVPAEANPGRYEAFIAFLTPDGRALPANGKLSGIAHPGVSYLWLGPVDIDKPSIPLKSEFELRTIHGGPIR